jgi:type I restriction enzyme S subunit
MKKGWTTKPLGDVATVAAGNSAPQDEALFKDGTIPFFRTADAGRVRFGDILESEDYLNERGAAGLRRFQQGTILFPKSGASTFLNHRVMLGVEGCVSSHLATIVADEAQAHPRFLLYFLSTVQAQDLVQDHAYPSLNLPTIAGIQVHLPPLAEQQRIVGVLDEAFAGLATAQAHAAQNLQNARALFESHLHSVFTHRGQGWVEKPLGELCTGVEYGSSAKSKKEGKIPVLRMGNIQDGRFDWEDLVYTDDKEEIARYTLRHNDVLFNRTNSPELVGKTAIYKSERPAIFAGYLIRIHRKPELLDADYLNYFLNSRIAFDYGKTVVISSVNQANINGAKLKTYPIPTPPLNEQKRIVTQLDALAAETQRLTRLYEQKQAALAALKKSLLHQAFTGAL